MAVAKAAELEAFEQRAAGRPARVTWAKAAVVPPIKLRREVAPNPNPNPSPHPSPTLALSLTLTPILAQPEP